MQRIAAPLQCQCKSDAADEDGTAGEAVLKAHIIRARGNYGDKNERTLEGLEVYGIFFIGLGGWGKGRATVLGRHLRVCVPPLVSRTQTHFAA